MPKRMIKKEVHELDNAERVKQLEKIDKLRELGVGDEINLPQLVVVGDQSSGKSSVLEGLTGLPFPVASELCTRFVTQIVFRRSSSTDETIQVSIVPAAHAEDDHRERLQQFAGSLPDLTTESCEKLLNEAAKCMGLPGIGDDVEDLDKRFSDDLLKIEISGPDQHHLSFADCPGLFHNPTKYQTLEDAGIIRGLIEGYVRDRRTIILAVMDSRNNLANQEVFQMAKAADKEGIRTVGIMTKLDALQKGDEPAAIRIAKNQTTRLFHGWYCVRNRSTQEYNAGVTMEERHRNENNFFRSEPWDVLDKRRVGIGSLKASIGRLLSDHVAKEFPEIMKEIDVRYSNLEEDMAQLGSPRETAQQQLQFLIKLAGDYQQKTEDSLNGRYTKKGLHPSKLRMHLQNANQEFNDDMHRNGLTMAWRSTDESYHDFLTLTGLDNIETLENRDETMSDSESEREALSSRHLYETVRALYITSRGKELVGINPAVLQTLFAQQSSRWDSIAKRYLTKVITRISACHIANMMEVCRDKDIRAKLGDQCTPWMEKYSNTAREELRRILDDERKGTLLTNNHYFANNLAAARAERVVSALKKLGYVDGKDYTMSFKALTSVANLSNEAAAVQDIHDTLKAYYKVAIKRFIDNVVKQVVERNLLGPEGPLSVFSPHWVGQFDSRALASIVGEDSATVHLRSELSEQISRLEEARKICSGQSVVNGQA